MNLPDFDTLSENELRNIIAMAEHALQGVQARKRKEALEAARSAARDAGFDLDDLVNTPAAPAKTGTRKPRAASTVLYANPQDATQTWNGRGRPPAWYREALEGGATKESLAKS